MVWSRNLWREVTREYIRRRTSDSQLSHLRVVEPHLESWHHLPFFLSICGVVEVLHTDERGKAVGDCVI